MIKIEKSEIIRIGESSRLSAEITIDGECVTLWFAVSTLQERYFSVGRADAFVMALLPMAMREGHELICEDAISERLRYQLVEYLIPTLAMEQEGEFYKKIQITAPSIADRDSDLGKAVGVSYNGKDDLSQIILCHGKESIYPLTHILAFNTGTEVDQQNESDYIEQCKIVERFAVGQGLETVCVNTNFIKVLSEKIDEVSSFRRIACALALQRLLSIYLLPVSRCVREFSINLNDCRSYDMLITCCASTESISVYSSNWIKAKQSQNEEKRIIKMPIASFRQGSVFGKKEAEKGKKPIIIGKPYTVTEHGRVRLCAPILLHSEKKTMWIEVKPEYASYLTIDRADPFVVALLTTAMRDGTDIICKSSVTRRLLYQLNQYLIPMMTANPNGYKTVNVYAKITDHVVECCGAVGTGWTGGVDSLFTIKQNLNEAEDSSYKLSHLMITSNGAIVGINPSDTLDKMVKKAENGIIPELGLKMLGINSNIQEILSENFAAVVSIRHAVVILALQRLFRVFLISSGGAFSQVSLEEGVTYYEPFVLNYLSTDNIFFYSSGSPFTRLQKLRQLSEFPLAEKYLHPCIYALRKNNCGNCGKCVRTQVGLYAIGTLDYFSAVFDLRQFERKKALYLAQVILQEKQNPKRAEIMQLICTKKMGDPHTKWWMILLMFRNKLIRGKNVLTKLRYKLGIPKKY